MPAVPGTIDLGKFRVVYEEERQHRSDGMVGYVLQQRAIIRLNEALVKLERPEDYTVYCNDEKFKRQHGKGPSPLQYFIASIGFCMFSQFKRLAAKMDVRLNDLQMELRMTYDLSGRFPIKDSCAAARGVNYLFKMDSAAPADKMIKVAQFADKGCHTVNSMRKHMPVAGTIIFNDREHAIID